MEPVERVTRHFQDELDLLKTRLLEMGGLAEEHVRLLRNFATRIVLAFDADKAGQAAAGRIYERRPSWTS